jgi:SAM-dependent methyltransferase
MDPAAYIEMDAIEERHWWFRGKRRLLAPLIRRMLDRSSEATSERASGKDAKSATHIARVGMRQTVLEIGCGTGGNLAHFGARHAQARFLGLDFDSGAVAFSRDKSARLETPFAVLQGDGLHLPIASGSLDGALALDIIEHFEDDGAVCAELARVLAPGASLVLSVPAWPGLWSPHDEFLHHARRYRPVEIRQLVEAAGLVVMEERGFNFLLLPPIWLVRKLKSRKSAGKSDATEEAGGTDFFGMPRAAEALLAGLFVLEAALVRILPIRWGVSIMMRATKPRDARPNAGEDLERA